MEEPVNPQKEVFFLDSKQSEAIKSRMRFAFFIWGSYLGSAILYPFFQYLRFPENALTLPDTSDYPNFFSWTFVIGIFLCLLAFTVKSIFFQRARIAFPKNSKNEIDLDLYLKTYESAILYSQGVAASLVLVSIIFISGGRFYLFWLFYLISIITIFRLRPIPGEIEDKIHYEMNQGF